MRRRTLALYVSAMIVCACSGGGASVLRSTVASEEPAEAEAQAASAPPAIPLEEDPVPAGASCESSSSCEDGQHCRGPAGCESEWACAPARECGEATVSYCGCEGLTFYALEGCPGQPYQHAGPCAALGEEIAADEVEEVEGNTICTSDADCRAGFVCAGAPGCGTFWTCVRRRALRCARDRAPFCSCAGTTFFSRSRCPGQPIAHTGYCPGDEPEAVASAEAAAAPPAAPAAAPSAEPAAAEARLEPPPPPTPAPPAPPVIAAGRAEEPRAPPSPPPIAAARSEPPPTPPAPPREIEPSACMSSRDCPRGEVCAGEPGCGTEWRCERPRERCVADTQYFCGCDGASFRASMTCPGRPHRHRGSCPRE